MKTQPQLSPASINVTAVEHEGRRSQRQGNRAKSNRYAQRPLHICIECGSQLVELREWWDEAESIVHVIVRCPECWHVREGDFLKAVLMGFDHEIKRGSAILLKGWEDISHANLVWEVGQFIDALEQDGVLPYDF